MMNNYFLLLAVACVTLCVTSALDCGIASNQNQEELKRVSDACMKGGANRTVKEIHSDEHASEESSDEGGFDLTDDVYGYRRRHKRSDDEEGGERNRSGENNDEDNQNSNDTDAVPSHCVVKCVFERLDMMNAKGYPDHGKVSQALLRSAQGRELRDFLQDTADECFQLMDQVLGDRLDSCMFSAQLVKCLAEKGKSNCSDWPASDLPFAHVL